MSNWITPERIAKMQKWLLEHPIDHKYDEMCDMLDSPAPPEQLASRCAYDALKKLASFRPASNNLNHHPPGRWFSFCQFLKALDFLCNQKL